MTSTNRAKNTCPEGASICIGVMRIEIPLSMNLYKNCKLCSESMASITERLELPLVSAARRDNVDLQKDSYYFLGW